MDPGKNPTMMKTLEEILEAAIRHGFLDFYAGGALGWDTLCAEMVLKLREQYPDVALHLVLPCPPEEQVKCWREADQEVYYQIYEKADSHEFTSGSYRRNCMHIRNQRLVQLSDCCIAYCENENAASGGTVNTVRYARRKQVPVFNLVVDNALESFLTYLSEREKNPQQYYGTEKMEWKLSWE